MKMMLRPYKAMDGKVVASWIKDERALRLWSSDRFGDYPVTAEDINYKYFECNGDCEEEDNFYPVTAVWDGQVVGHMILRFTDSETIRFGFVIVDILTDRAEIVDIGVSIMRVIIVVVLFQVQQVVYMGCLRGAGDTKYTAIAAIISVTIIRTLFSYVFGYSLGLGINGVWVGIFADQLSRYIFGSVRFKAGKWTSIKI